MRNTKQKGTEKFKSPAVLFNSVANSADRLAKIKNMTMFEKDLKANKLPQWMFITPNMTSDAHDAPIGTAGAWLRTFLEPLLNDKHFMQNTLVLVTFDENGSYPKQNRVFSVLLGDAIPQKLVGTTDANFYNHYSEISTVEANWDLHTLGRYDVGANVFANVAKQTHDEIRSWKGTPAFADTYFNASYPGIFHSTTWAPQPVPNTELEITGRTVLPLIKKLWGSKQAETVYCGQLEIPTSFDPPTTCAVNFDNHSGKVHDGRD
jgi:acid phosphatase